MKFFSSESVFSFTWDQVVAGFWQRYPNPKSKHVLSEDVVERRVEGDKLFTKRLISKTNSVPKWGEKFVHGLHRHVYIVEESVVDLNSRTFVTYTRNIGLQKLMSIDEKCFYEDYPDNPASTVCHRQAWISSGIFGFSGMISSFGVQRFKKNSRKAVKGFEYVLNRLYNPDCHEEQQRIKEIKDKAKEYAKSKANSVKSKVQERMTSSCET